jgi:hypothetical protein
MVSFVGLAIIGLFLTLGWLLAYAGVNRYRQRSLVADTPTSKVRSLAMGRVELEGTVEPLGETFPAPFSGQECVLYRYSIEQYYEDDHGNDEWQPAESGVQIRAFYLNDGTGRVMVGPANANLDVRTNVYEVGAGEADPPAVREFLRNRHARFDEHRTGGLAMVGHATFDVEADGMRVGDASQIIQDGHRRRYVEEVLLVGEEVYVFGKAKERPGMSAPDNAANVIVEDADDIPTFTISHRSEEEVLDYSLRLVASLVAFGLALVVFAFVGLVAMAGPVLGVVFTAVSLGVAYAGKDYVQKVRFGSPTS